MYFWIGTWWISIDIIECLGYHLPSTPSHHNFLDSTQLKAFIPISNVIIYALATEDFFSGGEHLWGPAGGFFVKDLNLSFFQKMEQNTRGWFQFF